MSEFKIYEYESLEEYAQELPAITFNWNVIKICYELWYEDIIAKRKADIKLHKIAGVGENYINEICAGRITSTRKLFHAETDEVLLPYLRGNQWIIEKTSRELKRYVCLNIAYNTLTALKKIIVQNSNKSKTDNEEHLQNSDSDNKKKRIESIKTDIVCLEEWIAGQCKKPIKEELAIQKNKLIDKIKYHGLGNYDDNRRWGMNVYGRLKNYLEGGNTKEVVLSENNEKIAFLFSAIYQMPYSMIESLDDKSLEELYKHVKVFYDKIETQVKVREVQKMEREFYQKVAESIRQNEEDKNT